MNLLNQSVIDLKFHIRFNHKKKFDFEEETYDCWVLFLNEKGVFKYEMPGVCRNYVRENEIVICPPKQTFKRETVTPVTLNMFRFNISGDKVALPVGNIPISLENRLLENIRLLNKHAEENNIAANFMCKHILNDILCIITTDTFSPHKNITVSGELNEILDYIHFNIGKKLTVNALADKFAYSSVGFIRKFQSTMNITPNQYITTLRISNAKELLLSTNLKINKIATICGFENEYYFSNAFKKNTGIAPTEFRVKTKF